MFVLLFFIININTRKEIRTVLYVVALRNANVVTIWLRRVVCIMAYLYRKCVRVYLYNNAYRNATFEFKLHEGVFTLFFIRVHGRAKRERLVCKKKLLIIPNDNFSRYVN